MEHSEGQCVISSFVEEKTVVNKVLVLKLSAM